MPILKLLPNDDASHVVAARSVSHCVRREAVVEEFLADLRERQLLLVIDSHLDEIDNLLRRQRVPNGRRVKCY